MIILTAGKSASQEVSSEEGIGPAENSRDIVIIRLNSGGQIKGFITEKSEKGIVVDVGFGTVAFSKDDIEGIDTPGGKERDNALSEWKAHVSAAEVSEKERKRELSELHKRIRENRRLKEEIAERARRVREHRIMFADSSRIVVEAVLNGKVTTPLLVDTGATTVVIPLKVARQLVDIRPEKAEKVATKLADGTMREGIPIMLESVEISGARAENVQAVTMDLRGTPGLLGMSFLNRFHMKVDSGNHVLILKEK
ncbi:MAG: retropepsin-like aspartic protease [Candidatus Omnitrophota bacterium]|nr:retropepsin-like aspartic protease [Candidatus Omnitrophota bacterium]